MVRPIALALTFLTGFSGLAYEVAWEKYLATLLGSHSEATAAVLGIFLGALSLGYWLFGSVTRRLLARRRAPRLLLLYGAVEAGIGLYVLAFPALFRGALAASLRLPEAGAGLGFAFDVALAALLIGPPAVAMGATIPVLSQALARSLADATRVHALVYACNTAGAFFGALAAGFFLIPGLGLPGVMGTMGCVNLAAGAVFVALGLRRREPPAPAPGPATSVAVPGARAYAAAALCVGFAMMAIQTCLIRLGGLAFGASPFIFSMVVAVFVLCIALGSFAVSALGEIRRSLVLGVFWSLVALLLLLHGPLESLPWASHVIRSLFRDTDAAFYPYHLVSLLALLGALGLPLVLAGATLPLLFHQLRREVGELGASAGRLYGANTLGSLLGALLGGYWLLLWVDLDEVYRIGVAALAVAAGIVSWRVGGPGRRAIALLPVAGLLILALPGWRPERLSSGAFRVRGPLPISYRGPELFFEGRAQTTIFYDDDPISSVAVQEDGSGRAIVINGKSDSHTHADRVTTILLGLLPALFAERVERAMVIGLGTGVTAGALAELESVREVRVAEISPAVIRAAPLFDFANHEASRNPKVEVLRGDAHRLLVRSPERYDVIVSEPSNPWVNGVEMLYSREFLEAARERLAPGGVYAQWMHEYETDDETVALILRTYRSVFEHVSVWYGAGPDLILLGFRNDRTAIDLERLEQRVARPQVTAALERMGIDGLAGLLAHELLPMGVLHAASMEGPLHTLVHPRLNHQAARGFFRGARGRPPFTGYGQAARQGRRNSLLGRLEARHGAAVPDAIRDRVVAETCRHRRRDCETRLARWRGASPGSPVLRARLDALAGSRRPPDVGRVERLARLFGHADDLPASLDPAQADAFSRLYTSRYLHGAPFQPDALLAIWQRCQPPEREPEACEQGLAAARSLLTRGSRGPVAAARRTP